MNGMNEQQNDREGRSERIHLLFDNVNTQGNLVNSFLDQPTSSMWSEKLTDGSLPYAGTLWLAATLVCPHSAHSIRVVCGRESVVFNFGC